MEKELIGQDGDIRFIIDSPMLKNIFYNSTSLNCIKWKKVNLKKLI